MNHEATQKAAQQAAQQTKSQLAAGGGGGGGGSSMPDIGGVFKLLVAHLQVTTSFTSSVSVPWPSVYVTFGSVFSFVDFDFVSMATPCYTPRIYEAIWVTFVIPIIVIIIIVVVHGILSLVKFFPTSDDAYSASMKLAVKLVFVVYPFCSAMTLSIFMCQEVGGSYYQIHDYRFECYTDQWTNYAIISIAGFVLYPLGCPLFYWILIRKNKHKLYHDEKCKMRYGFIYLRYEPRCYSHEILEMLRKFLMTGAIGLFDPGSTNQLLFGVVIAGGFLVHHVKYQPFVADDEDHAQSASLFATAATLLLAISLKTDPANQMAKLMLLTVTVGTIVFILVLICKIVFDSRATLERAYQNHILAKGKEPVEESDVNAHIETPLKEPMDLTKVDLAPTATPASEESSEESDETAEEGNDRAALLNTRLCPPDHICAAFDRYDLDGSGKLNTNQEREQLLMNLLYSEPNKKVTLAGVMDMVSMLDDLDEDNAWSVDQFWEWYSKHVLN